MQGVNIWKRNKIGFLILVLSFFTQVQAQQNEQISIDPISNEEFTVRSLNGIPFTVIIEKSNTDGQYHMGINDLTFKVADMIDTRSTLRIVFEKEIYLSLENKLIDQYRKEVDWIKALLEIKGGEFEVFPSRPVLTDADLEKLKQKVFQYTTTPEKEDYFNQWIEKINYSVGAERFFKELYAASNGVNNSQRHNFLPINIYDELQKKRR